MNKISALSLGTFVGLISIVTNSSIANAQISRLERCAQDPLVSIPQTIDLLKPIDQKMINCIPGLDRVASTWQRTAKNIQNKIGFIKVGNNGKSSITRLKYHVGSKTIDIDGTVLVSHKWKVTTPEVKEKVPVDKWRWVDVPYPDVRWVKHCWRRPWPLKGKTCVKKPQPFTNYRREKVPYVAMEMRVIVPKKTVSASAAVSCSLDYTYNLSTNEKRPRFGCDLGKLGSYKADFSPIITLLNGDVPSIGQLVTAVKFTPPLFIDNTEDTYNYFQNKIRSRYPNSHVYFSSHSFVRWASAENQGVDLIASVVSGGSYGAEFARKVTSKLNEELAYMSSWASTTGAQIGASELFKLMRDGSNHDFNGYNIRVETLNVPEKVQKCEQISGECIPAVNFPRLGFAVIATPKK